MYGKRKANFHVITMAIASLFVIYLASLSYTINNSLIPLPFEALAQGVESSADSSGQKIVQQGIATSSPDPLPGHEAHQSVTLLRLREDNGVYSGRVTFTATQPVEVQIIHRDLTNASTTVDQTLPNIPEKFGKLAIIQLPGGNGQVTITNVVPKFTEGATGNTFAASVPYSGNAVALHNLEGKPFAAVFTVTADILGPAERVDDIGE
jgi:hypothetical protein